MTSWVNRTMWHRWLDETGYMFDIAQFYYQDEDTRFPVVQVASWLSAEPDAMASFLSCFQPDCEDVALTRAELSKLDETAIAVLRRWIAPVFIEEDEKRNVKWAVEQALGILAVDNIKVSDFTRDLLEKRSTGELTFEQARAAIRDRARSLQEESNK